MEFNMIYTDNMMGTTQHMFGHKNVYRVYQSYM
jgi:hypothetical protein